MGRTISALVTWDDTYLGAIGPFVVDDPWWSMVEPVAAHLRDVLGVPVFVLRLLTVEGGFLDGIEPSERIYHLGDPAACIRAALKSR